MEHAVGTVGEIMTPASVFVSAAATAARASAVLREHRLPVLPVVAAGKLAGVLAPLDLLGERPFRRVSDLMTRGIVPVSPDLPLLQAHALLTSQGLEVIPVIEGGRVVGQLTLSAVLRAINQQTDPLTSLLWATALRTWAANSLARRREVAVLFIDLDNFREVNKSFGHVAGDRVLRTVADMLRRCIDPMTDLLCRYGGDEFAIATTRTHEEAHALAGRIRDAVQVPVDGTDRRVTLSVGYAGGRRREDREPGHAAATVDDLLALASRASTAAKTSSARRAAGQPLPESAGEARVRLLGVRFKTHDGGSSAEVRLRLGSREVAGTSSGFMLAPNPAPRFVVAEATLQALHGILGETVYSIEDILDSLSVSYPLVVAVLSGPSRDGRASQRYIGGATAPDLQQAVCKAVLDAVNRPLARRLSVLLGATPAHPVG